MSRGITLVEVLVALALLSLLGASAFLTLQFLLRSSAKRTQHTQAMQTLETMLQTFRADLQSASAASLSYDTPTGSNSSIAFQPLENVAANNATVNYSSTQLVHYRLEAGQRLCRAQWLNGGPVPLLSPPARLSANQLAALDSSTATLVRYWDGFQRFVLDTDVAPPQIGRLVTLRLRLARWGDETLDVQRTFLLRNIP